VVVVASAGENLHDDDLGRLELGVAIGARYGT